MQSMFPDPISTMHAFPSRSWPNQPENPGKQKRRASSYVVSDHKQASLRWYRQSCRSGRIYPSQQLQSLPSSATDPLPASLPWPYILLTPFSSNSPSPTLPSRIITAPPLLHPAAPFPRCPRLCSRSHPHRCPATCLRNSSPRSVSLRFAIQRASCRRPRHQLQ